MKILAIIAAHNEGDVIYHVLRDLIENGIQVYLIDDASTDNTVKEAERLLRKGLIHLEKTPVEKSTRYVWRDLLARKEAIAREISPDWCIHADADEFREAPWIGTTLAQAFHIVDEAGYSAVNFELLNFRPTEDSFKSGTDVRKSLVRYERGSDCDRLQIKAWKHSPNVSVDLVSSGGHEARFTGRIIFPIPFILRHYPLRSVQQIRQKIAYDRCSRFDSLERSAGWHIQYDGFEAKEPKLWKPSALEEYDGNAVRLEILDAYTRQPFTYDRYLASLLEERERLRTELIKERGEVARVSQAERERYGHLQQAEAALREQMLIAKQLEMTLLEMRAHYLAQKKKKIIIWGAGRGGIRALNYLQNLHIDVHAFLDSDVSKIGKSIQAHPVLAPSILNTRKWERNVSGIVIASAAYPEIESILKREGWLENIDFITIPQVALDQSIAPSPLSRRKRTRA